MLIVNVGADDRILPSGFERQATRIQREGRHHVQLGKCGKVVLIHLVEGFEKLRLTACILGASYFVAARVFDRSVKAFN